jgi:diaminopimelate epimerase
VLQPAHYVRWTVCKKRRIVLKFSKYHALGNVYIVVNPEHIDSDLSAAIIKNICHKNYGISSDGLLIGPLKSTDANFALRIFNPDGSEAEKSGNGLRIFCRYLWDLGLAEEEPFSIETKGGIVSAQVFEYGRAVKVAMGKVSFSSSNIPVVGYEREVILEKIEINGHGLVYSAVTIGNPHCVILHEEPTEEVARFYGSILETHSNFPNRTNVQFVKVMDRNNIKIEIWERGAGYTMASGSSSCAAASVVRKLGMCDKNIKVFMPGGVIEIEISEDFTITMLGSVTSVCIGEANLECLSQNV